MSKNTNLKCKTTYLKCKISKGQLDNEVAVEMENIHGTKLSLFCPREFVKFDGKLPKSGTIEVFVLNKDVKEQVLILLPRPMLEECMENSKNTIVVNKKNLINEEQLLVKE